MIQDDFFTICWVCKKCGQTIGYIGKAKPKRCTNCNRRLTKKIKEVKLYEC